MLKSERMTLRKRDEQDDRGLWETIKSRPSKNQDGLMSPLSGDGRQPASTEVSAEGYLLEEMMHLRGPRLPGWAHWRGEKKGRYEVSNGRGGGERRLLCRWSGDVRNVLKWEGEWNDGGWKKDLLSVTQVSGHWEGKDGRGDGDGENGRSVRMGEKKKTKSKQPRDAWHG